MCLKVFGCFNASRIRGHVTVQPGQTQRQSTKTDEGPPIGQSRQTVQQANKSRSTHRTGSQSLRKICQSPVRQQAIRVNRAGRETGSRETGRWTKKLENKKEDKQISQYAGKIIILCKVHWWIKWYLYQRNRVMCSELKCLCGIVDWMCGAESSSGRGWMSGLEFCRVWIVLFFFVIHYELF